MEHALLTHDQVSKNRFHCNFVSKPEVIVDQNHVNTTGVTGKASDKELAADGIR